MEKEGRGRLVFPEDEPEPEEELFSAAMREFREELGIAPKCDFVSLGSIKQKSGKTVYVWAFEAEPGQTIGVVSSTFEIEWPPRSGGMQAFPEIDRADPLAK